MLRRIFASSIVAALLFATPLAVACDLSCAFSFMGSDCHAPQTDSRASASAGMNMDGVSMPGMDMPEGPSEPSQTSDSAISPAHPAHPSIADMGACEKRPCDGSAISAKSSSPGDSHFQLALAATGTHRAEAARAVFRVARDEITNRVAGYESPFRLNLRI